LWHVIFIDEYANRQIIKNIDDIIYSFLFNYMLNLLVELPIDLGGNWEGIVFVVIK
jgi:hypothetical protein